MWIGHRKEIRKLVFRALALRRNESTKGYKRSKRPFSNLITVANSPSQRSW